MEQKQIGTSDYFILEDGQLWSDRQKGKFLKGMINNVGYRQYFLDGKWEFAHRLVGEYFVTKPDSWDESYEIDHLDENKLNNHWSNLDWVTHQENIKRSYADGGRPLCRIKGKDHPLYGRTKECLSTETRQLMSLSKQGKNHPKFKGWYVVKGVKYGSAPEAERETGIPFANIRRWCKSGVKGKDFTFEKI